MIMDCLGSEDFLVCPNDAQLHARLHRVEKELCSVQSLGHGVGA